MDLRIQFAAVFLVALAGGCGSKPAGSSTATKNTPVPSVPLVTQPDGFRIDFPNPPEPSQSEFESVFGTITVHHLTARKGDTLFSVAWHDYPSVLTDDERTAELGADWEEASNLGGLPAMEVVSEAPARTVGRMLLHERRFYSVQVGGAKDPSNLPETKSFFESFQIDSTVESGP